MTRVRALWLLGLVVLTSSCAKPQQLGGLGVFNPNGFEGRMALVGELGTTQAAVTQAEATQRE
jgi:hypothetical protein